MLRSRVSLGLVAVATALSGLFLTSCSGGDAATATASRPSGRTDCVATGTAQHSGLQYLPAPAGVDPRSLQMDISTPQFASGCAAPPVLLYVHGTNFRNGDISDPGAGVMEQLANARGWGFASMNYRLVGDPGNGKLDNSYPEQLQDVIAAIQWLSSHGGDNGVDGGRIALIGPYAGGFLTAQAAVGDSRVSTDNLASLRCAITLDTPGYDLKVVAAGSEAWRYWVERGFPDQATWPLASPIDRAITPTKPRSWLLVVPDSSWYLANAQDFARNVGAGGGIADIVTYTNDSEDIGSKLGRDGENVVTPAIVDTLTKCFKA